MKRCLFIVIVFLSCAGVFAQSDALLPGLHEAESEALLTYYTGSGWAQLVDGSYTTVESSALGDSVSFVVSGSQIVIYRELLATGGANAQICVDALCAEFGNSASIDQRDVPIAYPITEGAAVTITNSDGGLLRIDSFLILAAPQLDPVQAPDPSRQYFTLDDGSIAAVDQTISGGDVIQIALTAAVIALLVVLLVVVLWKD